MTEGEFLKEWVNNVANEYNEKDHHEYWDDCLEYKNKIKTLQWVLNR